MKSHHSFSLRSARYVASFVFATVLPLVMPLVVHAKSSEKAEGKEDPAKDFFASGAVVKVSLTLDEAARKSLKETPREYALCTVQIDGEEALTKVGIKLKGAAGSFRELHEGPGFTVNLTKFGTKHSFHGLSRFHLNNGAQDDSRLCEWVGNAIYTAAGLPAPRVSHARVTLDGKDLGLYVLREAYDKKFLQRVYGSTAGNLYDGGFCQDIDSELEKDAGAGPDDRRDLKALADVCREFTPEKASELEKLLDVNAFIDFMALEAMLGHWDGYTLNRNNYRVWCAMPPGLMQFLPHGMDQLLGDPGASILAYPPAMVASTVMKNPAWRKRYRERLIALLPHFDPAKLKPGVETLGKKLVEELAAKPEAAENLKGAIGGLIQRIEERYKNLQEQVNAPDPKPLEFDGEKPIALAEWHPAPENDLMELDEKEIKGEKMYRILFKESSKEPMSGGWRTTVLLGQGKYRITAKAKCEGVKAPPKEDDGQQHGGVRITVGEARSKRLFDTQKPQTLECEFEVTEVQREVEISLDMRALAGKAWYEAGSPQLYKLP